MQDAQGPTDSEDGASDSPRRASLRLRDAEAVASVRRDMFGDGSLLELAGGTAAGARAYGRSSRSDCFGTACRAVCPRGGCGGGARRGGATAERRRSGQPGGGGAVGECGAIP